MAVQSSLGQLVHKKSKWYCYMIRFFHLLRTLSVRLTLGTLYDHFNILGDCSLTFKNYEIQKKKY